MDWLAKADRLMTPAVMLLVGGYPVAVHLLDGSTIAVVLASASLAWMVFVLVGFKQWEARRQGRREGQARGVELASRHNEPLPSPCPCPLTLEAQHRILEVIQEGGFVAPTPRRH